MIPELFISINKFSELKTGLKITINRFKNEQECQILEDGWLEFRGTWLEKT